MAVRRHPTAADVTLPSPVRCGSRDGAYRCDRRRLHPGRHISRPDIHVTASWGTEATMRQTYETDAPWVTWTWLSTDRETRFTGRMRMKMTCCVCGKQEIVRPRIPRWGPVPLPADGVHPERKAAKLRHAHPNRGAPMSWALPLRNPFGQARRPQPRRAGEAARS